MDKTSRKTGFTLIELIVVIAMLMLLIGSVTSSVASARRRGQIVKATAAVQEMTNAILAYENYEGCKLANHVISDWQIADESSLNFILGKESAKIPVLYNAAISAGRLLDPWGRPYYVMIRRGQVNQEIKTSKTIESCVTFPNFNRRLADEVN